MVKVKQLSGEENIQGVSVKNYVEIEHSTGSHCFGGDDGELLIDGADGSRVAGYAAGHWASFTVG